MQHSSGHYIDGAWRAGEPVIERRNPSDLSDLVGRHPAAGPDEVEEAVAAARRAAPGWAEAAPQARCDLLDRIGAAIAARAEPLAELLSREEGKTLPEARAEIAKASHTFRYFAGEAIRQSGYSLRSTRGGVDVDVRREAVGVVALITPWNFPFSIPAWKTAPALAHGNCVILKPSELTCGTAAALAAVLEEAGTPRGVFQMLLGEGAAGGALVAHDGVDAVSFTGSVETGRRIAAVAAPRGARLQMELGGKNPLVVLADADLDKAVDAAVRGAFHSTGQRCTASSRIIVEAAIHDVFVARLVERTAALRVGHALDPASDVGPMVGEAQRRRVLDYIESGRREATLAHGGRVLERPTEGHYLEPALFLDGDMSQRINREEVFGPVASVFRVADLDEAIAVANATPFGLSAGIFTASHAKARDFVRRHRSGMVMVNLPTVGSDYHVPFGGRGASAYGPKEMGLAAAEFFTQTKTAYVAD
ncbi:aldehyde dehydrogenase family protein [Inquilinus limosus]|uniref:aldehyde dehydrogenase family protein n=1 Tax=Inquilinus limosus TaxID=171674 RepID=UPI0004155CED|nr:aldehyde dehydrogenase family protein [Inquilinus limosus]